MLLALADAWEAERVDRNALAERLEAERLASVRLTAELETAQKQVATWEQERKWWQENAIKRHRRAEARRSGQTPPGRQQHTR